MNILKNGGGTRHFGIDLLRILLAFLIVCNHSISHGIDQLVPELESQLLYVIQVVANPAVDVFFLISGYFGIRNGRRKIVPFVGTIYTYTIAVSIFLFVKGDNHPSIILKSILCPYELWWFVATYLMLLLFADYLNEIFDNADQKKRDILLCTILIVNTLQGFILNGGYWGNGFSFGNAVTIYILGRWLSYKKDEICKYRSMIYGLMLCVTYLITFLTGVISKQYGIGFVEERVLSYSNPLVILSACSMFLIFYEMEFTGRRSTGMIAYSSKTVFPVYIVTDHQLMRKYVFYPLCEFASKYGYVVELIILNAAVYCVIFAIVENLRLKYLQPLGARFYNCIKHKIANK